MIICVLIYVNKVQKMNLEDLQKAINILYNPSGKPSEVIHQAQTYCDQFTQQNASNLKDFFSLFVTTNDEPTRFWLLQAISHIINYYYDSSIHMQDQKEQVHQIYIQLLRDKPDLVLQQKHYLVKYAVIFVLLLRKDFPQRWASAFVDLFSLVQQTQDENHKKLQMSKFDISASLTLLMALILEFIVKVIKVIEEELVERKDISPRTNLEVGNRVKDGIRELAINDTLFLLNQVLVNFQVFDEETVNDTLEGIAQLIDWNSLDIFAPLVNTFKAFLPMISYRTNAINCLHAMVHKGMDYPQKVELIVNIQFLDVLESFKIKFTDRVEDASDEEQENEEEFFNSVSDIVNHLGQWCLELYQNQDKLLPTLEHQQQYEIIFRRVLLRALYLFDSDKPKIGRPVVEFMTFWLQAIKKFETLSEFDLSCIQDMLNVLIKRIKYPSWCTFEEGSISNEFEEDYRVYRDELSTLFLNIAMVKNFRQPLINILAELFQSINPQMTPANEAEVPLFLVYHLYSTIPVQSKESTDNEYFALISLVVKIDFLSYNHKITTLMYLEDIVRYNFYFIHDPNFLTQIVQIFFSNRAIFSNDPQVTSRSCYLLLRLCEKAQTQLVPYAPDIVEQTIQVIEKVQQGQISNDLINADDLIYLCNIIGLFVSQKKVDFEYRRKVVTQIMDSISSKLNSCSPHEKDKIQWLVKFLNVFIKGFQNEVSPVMKECFSKIMQQLLPLLSQNIRHHGITEQIVFFLQKNVHILGVEAKPFLAQVAQPMIQTLEFERLDTLLTIISHAITSLKSQMIDIIDFIFPDLLQRMQEVNVPSSDTSDIEKNQIKVFNQFFRLLIISVEVDSTFLFSNRNLPLFNSLIELLVAHFERSVDRPSKKGLAIMFREMFVDFSGLSNNAQGITHFSKRQNPDPLMITKDKSIVQRHPSQFQLFNERLLLIIVTYPFIMNPSVLDDYQVIKVLIEIQALYVAAGWSEQLLQAFNYKQVDPQVSGAFLQLCQQFAQKQLQLKGFLDNYIKLLKQVNAKQ